MLIGNQGHQYHMIKNGNGKVKIAVLYEKVEKIEKWVDNADVNHFPSLERRLDGIEQKIAYWSGGIVAAGAIIQLILKYLT